jgi:WD40 repeat protein
MTALRTLRRPQLRPVVGLLLALGTAGTVAGVPFPPPPTALPKAARPAAPKAESPAARVDLLGDPLPPGAVARLGTTRLRHASTDIVYTPDSQSLVTVQREIRIWEVATGRLRREIPLAIHNQPNQVSSFALSPDGRTLATGHYQNHVRLWDLQTGQEMRQLSGSPPPVQAVQPGVVGFVVYQQPVSSLTFSADGKRVAALGGNGGFGSVWDVATGQEVSQLKAPDGQSVLCLAFAPDGATVAGGAGAGPMNMPVPNNQVAGPVCFWSAADGKVVRTWAEVGGRVEGLAFSPDGALLALAVNGVVSVRAVESGREVWKATPGGTGLRVRFSPDGKAVAAVGGQPGERSAWVWEAAGGKEVRHWEKLASWMLSVAFAPDGRTLATANECCVRLWDIASGHETLPLPGHPTRVGALAVSPDGRTAVSSAYGDRLVRVWDLATGREVRQLEGLKTGSDEVTISPNGRLVAACDHGGGIHLWDAATGRPVELQGAASRTGMLRFTPDGRALACAEYNGRGPTPVRRWDPESGRQLPDAGSPAPFGLGALLAAPDGRILGVESTRLQFMMVAPAMPGMPIQPAANPQPIQVWDVKAGRLLHQLLGHTRELRTATISTDGRVLATRSGDGSVRLWELASGQERARFEGAGYYMTCTQMLALSPDGRTVAAPDQTGKDVHLWDAPTGQHLTTLKGHAEPMIAMEFTPDGRRLVTGGNDTTVLVWDVAAFTRQVPRPQKELDAPTLERLWADLRGNDGARAYRAVGELASGPGQAVPFLRDRLRPPAPVDEAKVARWVADLDHPVFATRERADRELRQAGGSAEPALRRALAGRPSPEARARILRILDMLPSPGSDPDRLREWRAVEALEAMGTPAARQLLADLTRSAPGTLLANEAQMALRRTGRPTTTPGS